MVGRAAVNTWVAVARLGAVGRRGEWEWKGAIEWWIRGRNGSVLWHIGCGVVAKMWSERHGDDSRDEKGDESKELHGCNEDLEAV